MVRGRWNRDAMRGGRLCSSPRVIDRPSVWRSRGVEEADVCMYV